jgi:hypothetical protein
MSGMRGFSAMRLVKAKTKRMTEVHPRYMAAPNNAAKREESSCQLGAVHTWALSGQTDRARACRSLGRRLQRDEVQAAVTRVMVAGSDCACANR